MCVCVFVVVGCVSALIDWCVCVCLLCLLCFLDVFGVIVCFVCVCDVCVCVFVCV